MRDQKDWKLSKNQRRRYLGNFRMLCGSNVGSEPIVPPRASVEASGAQLAMHVSPNVPRGTSKPDKPVPLREWREQEALYAWTQGLPMLRGHVMSLGNEQRRDVVRAAVAKRMGLLAGASDLFIARPLGRYAGFWLEMKQNRHYSASERRTVTWLRQEAFQERMRSAGYAAAFAFGCDDGVRLISLYLESKFIPD